MAPTACGTDLLRAEPLHHVAGVAPVSAGEAEVGGAAHGHVADGALEGEALADGALGAAHLAAAVAAVHAELCRREHTDTTGQLVLGEPWTKQHCTQPLKLPQSSTRMGEWVVFRELGLFSIRD